MNPEVKRSLVVAIVIGLISGGVVVGLHSSGLLRPLETALAGARSPGTPARTIGDVWHYALAVVASMGVAFMTLMATRRSRLAFFIGILLVELALAAWVLSLYHVSFQPLLVIVGTVLGFLLPLGFLKLSEAAERREEDAATETPAVALAEAAKAAPAPIVAPEVPPPIRSAPIRVKRSDPVPDSAAPQAVEVTAVVCDIANKHELAEECEPAIFIEIVGRFLAQASDAFRKAGGYIESAAGEGVVAIFGYPESDKQHAEKAARKAMEITQAFVDANKSGKSEWPVSVSVNAGVSTGVMIIAPVKNNGARSLLATGEPVELARRLCIANRFYGSRVLLGPRTFELASKILVARPIDFLSGIEARERHEIYEPIALALDATRDQITRRDAFWNGVVLYREKRWAEAYAKFQDARDPAGEEDRPLQLYLRRIEPLALQLTNTPLDE
jgi:class 3 adenylate cyclase